MQIVLWEMTLPTYYIELYLIDLGSTESRSQPRLQENPSIQVDGTTPVLSIFALESIQCK